MNEVFAADPALCHDWRDLLLLLSKSGPEFGRYLVRFPNEWGAIIQRAGQESGDVQAEKIKALLRRAKAELRLINEPSLKYDAHADWVDNLRLALSEPSRLDFAVVEDNVDIPSHLKTSWSEYAMFSASQEEIESSPVEIARVSEILCRMSHEIYIVDPYIDPVIKTHAPVLTELLGILLRGKCSKLTVVTREDAQKRQNIEVTRSAMMALLNNRRCSKKFTFNLDLYDDSATLQTDRLHDRFIFSIRGGIQFGRGFQVARKPGCAGHHRQIVTPLSRGFLDKLVKHFHEGDHNMHLTRRITAKVNEHNE